MSFSKKMLTKILKMRLIPLIILFPLLLVAGCGPTPLYQKASNSISQTRGQIEHAKSTYQQTPPPVETKPGLYVNNAPVKFSHRPQWLQRRIRIHGAGLPFKFYISKIMTGINADVSYQHEIAEGEPLSMDYSGTVEGALNRLAAISGYAYTLQGNTITWSDMISRTFDISFMPGSSQYMVGGENRSTSAATASSSAVYFGDLSSSRNQYSNLTGNVSVWQDLTETLNKLKSKQGQVVVSQATTTVTVYDHPRNVNMIASYLDKLNQELSRQVALQIHVLEVNLNESFNFGINWQLVRKVMGIQLGLAGQLAQPIRILPLGNNTGSVAGFILRGIEGKKWDGTNILINALKQQGNVSVVTEPRVVTLNNQVAEIGINTLTGYLESVSTTFTGNTAQFATESLTPGVVKTGFTLYILPKIEHNKIYLQITSNIANLENIQRIGSNSNKDAQNNSEIQVPTVNEKTFNQRSLVKTGDTLVIAGFKQLRNQANNAKMYGIPSAQGASQDNVETVILITPTILS